MIRIASFLAPNMLPVYQHIADEIARQLNVDTELLSGSSFDMFERGQADLGFICGLPYIHLAEQVPAPVLPIAAPVLQGERFAGRPVYFSDIIVKRGSPYRAFTDLRGCTWSFNDPLSQSGYGITLYILARLGETNRFFRRVIEAGFHQNSIRMVARGEVDASAIDCQVLAVELREHPELEEQIEVIGAFGPSTIQPVVASARLPESLREDLQAVVLSLGQTPASRDRLAYGFIERFAPVDDSSYSDIREMQAFARAKGVISLK